MLINTDPRLLTTPDRERKRARSHPYLERFAWLVANRPSCVTIMFNDQQEDYSALPLTERASHKVSI
jgi:hypothetical protein